MSPMSTAIEKSSERSGIWFDIRDAITLRSFLLVLGNPSAGGAFPRSMLPTFWRAVGAFLPPGAGTDAVRSNSYFGGARTGYPLLIMGGYALLGIVLSLLLCALKPRSAAAQTS